MAEQAAAVELDKTETIAEYKAGKAALAKAATEAAEKEPPEVVVEPEEKIDAEGEAEGKQPKQKTGRQARIDRLTKMVASMEKDLADERKLRTDLEAKVKGKTEDAKPETKDEPKREAFDSDLAYFRALAKWEVGEEIRLRAEADAKADFDAMQKEIDQNFKRNLIEAQSRYHDWKEVEESSDVKIHNLVGAVIKELDNAGDVMYHLYTHPEVADELFEAGPVKGVIKIGLLAKELAGAEKVEEKEGSEEKEEAEEKPEIKARPAPIRPVGATSRGGSSVPLDKMTDMRAYRRARETGRTH